MDERLRAVEVAIAGIKPALDNIGAAITRLDGTLVRLDQRMLGVETGLAGVKGELSGFHGEFTSATGRLTNVETAVAGALTNAISRVPSWWQMPAAVFATIVSGGGALGVLVAAAAWLRHLGWVTF